MIKKMLFLCSLLLAFLYSCDPKTNTTVSDSKNDSVKKYLDLAGNDTIAFRRRIKFNDKAYSFFDLKKNDEISRTQLNKITYNYLMSTALKKAKVFIDIYYEKSKQAKDTLGLARCYRYKGVYFKNTFVYDSAFYFYLKAERLYLTTNNKDELGMIYIDKSIVQYFMDDYLGAELSAKKSYSYLKESKSYFKIYSVLLNLGNIYHNLKQYDKSIATINKSLSLVKKYNLPDHPNNCLIGSCMNNIGNAYREQKKFNKAIYYFEIALKENKLLKRDPELYGYLQNNLGYCYLKTKNNKQIPYVFFKTDSIFNALGIKNEQSVSNIYLSEYYFLKKDTLKAIQYSEKALQLAKEAKAPYYYLTALSVAGTINYKKAPQYIREYHQKNDSLLFAERNARNQYYKIQLETDEISQEKDKAIQQKWIITGIATGVILIIVLILIITWQRAKQKELQQLQEQQKTNEEIYQLMLTQKTKEDTARQAEKKRIALELHDGIMNKLASTRLNLAVLSHKTDKVTIDNCLTHINDIYKIEQEIRLVSHDLNQEVFQQEDSFIKMLEDFIKEQNSSHKTHFELEIHPEMDWKKISNEIKMHLFRIIQEASYNITKYAKAKKATINILFDSPNICMSITDDGVGFDTTATAKGIGIQNMKVRVKSLEGKFTIHSIAQTSTSINIAIPV
jgi:signal transduction histidine kinase